MSEIKNIIFDFDGTIGDSFDIVCNIGCEIANKHGIHSSEEEFSFIFKNMGIRELAKKFSINKREFIELIYIIRHRFSKRTDEIDIFDGMKEVLEELCNEGYVLGIISSNSKKNVNKILQHREISKYFSFVKKTSLFGKHKTIEKVLQKEGMKKSQTIYVGDEIRDLKACRKIRVNVISVSWGFNSRNLLESKKARHIVDTPKELLQTITYLSGTNFT